MNDMSSVIVPKSDQINADDFIAGPQTFTIREVRIKGGQEQPVDILLEGLDKSYRPCKSMCRVLVQAWGADAKAYVGRSLTLYRDPSVKWGGLEVGGIRISHMSDINGKMQMPLTATRGQRKPHVVMPLVMQKAGPAPTDRGKAENWLKEYLASPTEGPATDRALAKLQRDHPDLYKQTQKVAPAEDDDPFAGPSDEQRGERDFARETADRLIAETKDCTDATDLGFAGDDLEAFNALPAELQSEVDAAIEARRAELTAPAPIVDRMAALAGGDQG